MNGAMTFLLAIVLPLAAIFVSLFAVSAGW